MLAENPVGYVVECAAPDIAGLMFDKQLYPAEHFAGRAVGKRDQHYTRWVHSIVDKPREAIR